MDNRIDALVLGIGNVLWADEGFGVRAVEALHAGLGVPRQRPPDGWRHAGTQPVRGHRLGAACAGVRRHRLRAARRHAQGAARRRSPGLGREEDLAAPDRLQRHPGAGATARHARPRRSPPSASSRSSSTISAAACARRCAHRLAEAVSLAVREARCLGLRGDAAARRQRGRAAQRAIARARRLRSRPALGGRRLPDRRPARARDHSPARRGVLTMCIGIPMQIVEPGADTAVCEGRGARERINCLMIGDAAAGTWVLTFQGTALRVLDADEAAQTNAALDALAAVLAGDTDIDAPLRRPRRPRTRASRPPPRNPLMAAIPMPIAEGADVSGVVPADRATLLEARLHRRCDAGNFAAFVAQPGHALLLFTEDPVRYKETLDLAVIVPELARAFPGSLRGRRAAARSGARVARPVRLSPLAGLRDPEGRRVRRCRRRPAQLGRVPRRGGCAAGGRAHAPAQRGHRRQGTRRRTRATVTARTRSTR